MFSKALKKMDENTVNFMIEQMKKALEEKDAALSEKTLLCPKKIPKLLHYRQNLLR